LVTFMVGVFSVAANNIAIPPFTWAGSLDWPSEWPACGWEQQSPINIPADTVSTCLGPLKYDNLHWPQNHGVLSNINDGAILILDTDEYPVVVSGGPLPKNSSYILKSLFFHIGSDSTSGSAHTIRGKSYAGEIKLYLTAEPEIPILPIPDSDTSKIIGVSLFIGVSPEDNWAWEPIIQGLSKIKGVGNNTEVNLPSIASLLPPYYTWEFDYYSYIGTWESPPCSSKLIRVVYTTPILLSERQLHAFRLLQDINGRPITNNYRRPMPTLDYRSVLHSGSY